jgi:hypothetical protein
MVPCSPMQDKTLGSSSASSPASGHPPLLAAGAHPDSALGSSVGSLGACWTLNTSEFPSGATACSLSEVLETPAEWEARGRGGRGNFRGIHPEILLEPDSLPGHPPPGREAGTGVAGSLMAGAGARGWRVGADEAGAGHVVSYHYHLAQITSAENRANPQPGDPAPALEGMRRQNRGPVLAFTERGRDGGRSCEWQEELAYALTSPRDGDRTHERRLCSPEGVRRLTPRECERLQGYPDDWTRSGRRENGRIYEHKDSPRYAMVGDGVTRPVAAWIGRRIAGVLRAEVAA